MQKKPLLSTKKIKTDVLQSGTFLKIKNSFSIDDYKFIIRERKTPTKSKPLYFISLLHDKDYYYISSLYPISENKYNCEYDKRYFTLTIEDENIKLDILQK